MRVREVGAVTDGVVDATAYKSVVIVVIVGAMNYLSRFRLTRLPA